MRLITCKRCPVFKEKGSEKMEDETYLRLNDLIVNFLEDIYFERCRVVPKRDSRFILQHIVSIGVETYSILAIRDLHKDTEVKYILDNNMCTFESIADAIIKVLKECDPISDDIYSKLKEELIELIGYILSGGDLKHFSFSNCRFAAYIIDQIEPMQIILKIVDRETDRHVARAINPTIIRSLYNSECYITDLANNIINQLKEGENDEKNISNK